MIKNTLLSESCALVAACITMAVVNRDSFLTINMNNMNNVIPS